MPGAHIKAGSVIYGTLAALAAYAVIRCSSARNTAALMLGAEDNIEVAVKSGIICTVPTTAGAVRPTCAQRSLRIAEVRKAKPR